MNILLEDATIWVLASFVIFVAIIFIKGRKTITEMLDSKIAAIRTEIANAEILRADAEKLLHEYEARQKAAHMEAERLLSNAKKQAAELHEKAERELQDTMQRRESMMKDRISRMEEQAMSDIRKYAADLAITATTEIITQKLDQAASQKLSDESIRKVAGKLN